MSQTIYKLHVPSSVTAREPSAAIERLFTTLAQAEQARRAIFEKLVAESVLPPHLRRLENGDLYVKIWPLPPEYFDNWEAIAGIFHAGSNLVIESMTLED